MRFLIDEDTCPCLAVYLRHGGHDAEAVCTKGRGDLLGEPDGVIFRVATAEDRVIITQNADDYLELHEQCLAGGRSHPGVVTAPQRGHRDFQQVFRWMDQLLNDQAPPTFADEVHHLAVYV